jgi:hypothetical protein
VSITHLSVPCRYPYAQDLSQVPRRQTPHLAREGSGVATCPMTLDPPPGEGGLWCHHASRGSRHASQCRKTLASWHVPWHKARLLTGEGSGVTTCPMIPDPPPSVGGLWRRHMALGGLWATSKREILNRSTYSIGPTYLRGVPLHSRDA